MEIELHLMAQRHKMQIHQSPNKYAKKESHIMETSNSLREYIIIELVDRIFSKVEMINKTFSKTYEDVLNSSIMRLWQLREKIASPAKNQRQQKIIYHVRDFISISKEIKTTFEDTNVDQEDISELSYLISTLGEKIQQVYELITPTKKDTPPNNLEQETTALKKILSSLKSEQSKQESKISIWINEIEDKLSYLNLQTEKINNKLQEEISKAQALHETVTAEINEKHTQINNILGIASSDVLSGDHGKNAATEEKTANRLRNLSVGCMLIILGVLGFTVWESTKSTFSWDVALFRVSIAFLLSVPAAYLARESAKHREQQYYYRQTALNLKAISPYIASLPEDEQHKLKIDIAAKIFSGREPSKFEGDSYPINIQEILIALLSKIETPSRNTGSNDKAG